jgi:hypothetical protein
LRSTFPTPSRRPIRAARTIGGSSFTVPPRDCGRWSHCYGKGHHGRHCGWLARLARRGAVGQSRPDGATGADRLRRRIKYKAMSGIEMRSVLADNTLSRTSPCRKCKHAPT